MKIRVDGLVWLPKAEMDPRVFEHLREKLLIVPKKMGNFGDDDVKPTPIKAWSETEIEFGVPRDFWFQTAKGDYEYEWDLTFGEKREYESTIRHEGPYKEQGEIVDKLVEHYSPIMSLEGHSNRDLGLSLGGIFQAGTGFGKTVTGLAFIHRMAMPAIILVHKELLFKQWISRAKKFFPGAKIGQVRGPVCDFEDKDIIVAMVESLALEDGNRYPRALYERPGVLVLDECHRVGAPSWSVAPEMFAAAIRLGLTATPRRKDGADRVFWWHIGKIIVKALTEMPKPYIRMVMVPKPVSAPPPLMRDMNDAVSITMLSKLTARNWKIIEETKKALKASSGRKILILSERLEHLRSLESDLMAAVRNDKDLSSAGITTGFYVGEWFTGVKTARLRKGDWPMEDGGREMAIDAIYKSLSRRKGNSGSIYHRLAVDEAGYLPIDEEGDHPKEKVHEVSLPAEILEGFPQKFLECENDKFNHSEDGFRRIILEDLSNDALYKLASYFKIKQKSEEKKRALTDEELYEAERARVVFASFQMVSEGTDIPPIDVVGFATPTSDVEQSVGRGRRHCLPDPKDPGKCEHYCPWKAGKCKGKGVPIIFDIVDIGVPISSRRVAWRERYYWSNEFKVSKG